MLERWLAREERTSANPNLDVRSISPAEDVDPASVDEWLGHELLRNYLAPDQLDLLESTFDDLGMPDVAEHLRRHTFPSDVSVRNGDFGEALGAAMFRRTRRYCVPILKLRFKHRPDQPVQGVDFIAFRLRHDPPVVAAPEVKTRTTRDLDVGAKAEKSLARVINDLPNAILFCASQLRQRGSVLGVHIAALLDKGFDLERHILLVHDEEVWDDRILGRLAGAVSERTEATVVRVPELAALITRAYAEAVRDAARIASRRTTPPPEVSGA